MNVKSILNSEERIALYLSSFKEQKKKYDLPLAVTRGGIAKATCMGLSHASRKITSLKKKNYLNTINGRPKGKNRNQDFHFLNAKGRKYAESLLKNLKRTKIEVIGLADSPKKMGFYSVLDYLNEANYTEVTLLDICRLTSEEGELDVRKLQKGKKKKYVDATSGVPEIVHFFGRVDEVNKLHNWIDEKDKHNIIFIYGMAGIGKTTLAAKLIEDYRNSRHLFWYDFHEMDTFRGILFKLAGFLSELGNDHLDMFLRTRSSYDFDEISRILGTSIGKLNAILVFDDFQKSNAQIRKFFVYFLGILTPSSETKMIILSREIVPFYDSRDVLSKKTVAELGLEGLDYESSKKILREKGIKKGSFKDIYGFTAGNPLFLEAFQIEGHLDRFVHDELFSKLGNAEKKVLSYLSIYRYPISEDSLGGHDEFDFETLYTLTQKSLVKKGTHNRYFIHDILKRFFYSRLGKSNRNGYHLQAASYFLSKKDSKNLIEAIYHYQEAEQKTKASKIAIENTNKILDSGYLMEYDTLLQRFDEKELKPDIYGEILIAKGRVYTLIGEWKKALNYFNECIDFATINNIEKIKIRAFCESGHILEEQNELKKAKEFFQKGLEYSKGIEYSQGMCENFRGLGRIYWRNSKFKMAIKNYNKCVELCKKSGEYHIMASAYIDLGNTYDEMYDTKKAIEYYNRSIDILTNLNNSSELGRAYMNLAVAYKHNEEFEKAIENYKKHVELVKPTKTVKFLGYGYSGISFCYAKINEIKNARKFLKRAENIALKIENENIMYEVYNTYAQINWNNNKLKEAANYLKKSLAIVERLDAKYYLAYSHYEIGLLFEEMGDRNSAKNHFIAAKDFYAGQDPKKVELVKEKLSKY